MKHTKGPWYVTGKNVRQESSDIVICNIDDGGHCDDSVILISSQEQEVNAHLIASAPELLEAVKELYQNLKRDSGKLGSPHVDYALQCGKEAIAKAEREED